MPTKQEIVSEIENRFGVTINADKYTKEQLEAHMELLNETQAGPQGPQPGVTAQVHQQLPMLRVRLAPGQQASWPTDPYDHNSVVHYTGDDDEHPTELVVDGAAAMVLVQGGAEIVGTERQEEEGQ